MERYSSTFYLLPSTKIKGNSKIITYFDKTPQVYYDIDFELEDVSYKINEINTIPGFTKISMYPRLWEASGIPYSDLIDRLIQLALERFRRERYLSSLNGLRTASPVGEVKRMAAPLVGGAEGGWRGR